MKRQKLHSKIKGKYFTCYFLFFFNIFLFSYASGIKVFYHRRGISNSSKIFSFLCALSAKTPRGADGGVEKQQGHLSVKDFRAEMKNVRKSAITFRLTESSLLVSLSVKKNLRTVNGPLMVQDAEIGERWQRQRRWRRKNKNKRRIVSHYEGQL